MTQQNRERQTRRAVVSVADHIRGKQNAARWDSNTSRNSVEIQQKMRQGAQKAAHIKVNLPRNWRNPCRRMNVCGHFARSGRALANIAGRLSGRPSTPNDIFVCRRHKQVFIACPTSPDRMRQIPAAQACKFFTSASGQACPGRGSFPHVA